MNHRSDYRKETAIVKDLYGKLLMMESQIKSKFSRESDGDVLSEKAQEITWQTQINELKVEGLYKFQHLKQVLNGAEYYLDQVYKLCEKVTVEEKVKLEVEGKLDDKTQEKYSVKTIFPFRYRIICEIEETIINNYRYLNKHALNKSKNDRKLMFLIAWHYFNFQFFTRICFTLLTLVAIYFQLNYVEHSKYFKSSEINGEDYIKKYNNPSVESQQFHTNFFKKVGELTFIWDWQRCLFPLMMLLGAAQCVYFSQYSYPMLQYMFGTANKVYKIFYKSLYVMAFMCIWVFIQAIIIYFVFGTEKTSTSEIINTFYLSVLSLNLDFSYHI